MAKSHRLSKQQIKDLEATLQRADILLVHTKGFHPIAWAIRWGTSSYWNHAALIYLVPSEDEVFPRAFTIESQGDGIDIHKLSEYYLKHTDRYDLGIKRLAASWYGDGKSPLALEFARKVRGFALQEVDDKYSFLTILRFAGILWWVIPTALHEARVRTIAIIAVVGAAIIWLFVWLASTIPQIFFTALAMGLGIPLAKFICALKEKRGIAASFKGEEVNNYICSGFVQWVYYHVFDWFRRNVKVTQDMKPEHIDFTYQGWDWDRTLLNIENLSMESKEYKELSKALLSTTPADLAMSENLSWVHFIKDGQRMPLPGRD